MHIYVYQTIIVAENGNKKHSEELRKQCLETELELNNATNELNCPRRMQSIKKTKESFCTEKYRRIFQSVISGQKDDEGAGKLMNPDYGISGGCHSLAGRSWSFHLRNVRTGKKYGKIKESECESADVFLDESLL